MVHRPNPVQSISQQRQQFALGGQQPIHHELSDLAMEIYVRLVARHNGVLNEAHLRQLAKDAQTAAAAYFAVLSHQEKANG